MENLKPLREEQLKDLKGGFVPLVILGTTYSAKAVAGYFFGVAATSSGITLAAISNNSCDEN